jgi:hypothetical protein
VDAADLPPTSDGSVPSEVGYDNWSQVTADMAKPEYRKDPSYQQEVQDKLARSKL